jgi:hypothetical protein
MNTTDGIFAGPSAKNTPAGDSPMVKAAKATSEEAAQFQLKMSEQATALAKLKVFHSMAKQINDQQ